MNRNDLRLMAQGMTSIPRIVLVVYALLFVGGCSIAAWAY